MPAIMRDPPSSSCYRLFPVLESRNLKDLLLIAFRLLRAGARQAPEILAAQRMTAFRRLAA